jgi:uncharacterized membrane protein
VLGLNPLVVRLLGIIANSISVPIIFYFLEISQFNKLALKLFGKKMMKKIDKNKKKFEIFEEIALIFFVAIPLPVTGAWTASLIAHILKFNKKRSFLVISLGIIIAGLIVFFSTLGVINIL